MSKVEINYIEAKLENGWWIIYENCCAVIGKQFQAKDRHYAVLEGRELAKKLAPSEFRVLDNGIEMSVEQFD